jgi:hypothetical protein
MMTPDENPPVDGTKKTSINNIPDADIDLRDVAVKVQSKWEGTPALTLLWTAPDAFKLINEDYSAALQVRQETGGTRPQFTGKLKTLDKEINKSLDNVKRYLAEKYTKAVAPDYYAAFGIIKVGRHYILPKDRNLRSQALSLLIGSLPVHGFGAFAFGTAYWTGVKTNYDTWLAAAGEIDGTVSQKVGTKNELKKQIRKILNALINLLKANYPDTYKAEMREWGFQKEKY